MIVPARSLWQQTFAIAEHDAVALVRQGTAGADALERLARFRRERVDADLGRRGRFRRSERRGKAGDERDDRHHRCVP